MALCPSRCIVWLYANVVSAKFLSNLSVNSVHQLKLRLLVAICLLLIKAWRPRKHWHLGFQFIRTTYQEERGPLLSMIIGDGTC